MTNIRILNHDLELIDIKDFKKYFLDNINCFNGFSKKAFLKAVDIPPAYFLEQPEDTKLTLLNNKEERINNLPKYNGKCIVVLWKDGQILNACRMDQLVAEMTAEQLITIEDIEGIIWHKDFYKDGYIQGYIPVGKVEKTKYNKCLVIDFPILLNKPAILYEAFFKMPNEESIVNEDLIYYNTSTEVDFSSFQHIALAVENNLREIEESETISLDEKENSFILKETEEVICMMVEEKILPKTILNGIVSYISTNFEGLQLTVNKLTEIVLSFEGNMKNIKQVTNLRDCYNYLYDNFTQVEEVLV